MKGQCAIYYGQIQMVSPTSSISEVQPSEEELARAGPLGSFE